MQISKIKPVPKYIIKRIKETDLKDNPDQDKSTRYYSYLTKNNGELVKVTVAVRNRSKKWYYKQCAIHGIHSDRCFIKDMLYTGLAGYRVGWYEEGLSKYPKWYEDKEWGWQYDRMFDMYAPVVNFDYLQKLPAYRYSAVELQTKTDVIQYLRLYEQYPFIEYLVKAGLNQIAMSKTILKQIQKDKNFPKWLLQHKQELMKNYYYVDIIIKSYKTGKPLKTLQANKELLLEYAHDFTYKLVLREVPKIDRYKLVKYLKANHISLSSYHDYVVACNYLKLNMNENRNLFPHDFKRWHDIRIDEQKTAKAKLDVLKQKELYSMFAEVADKYKALQYDGNYNFVCIIAKSPQELFREGEELHHCVGKMGYDQKFIREDSLIFFIRIKDQIEKPYITIEYSPAEHKILQTHGLYNCMPDEQTATFINKVWLPYANKTIKKIAA